MSLIPKHLEPSPLDVAELALRWKLSEKEVHRRLKQIHLPSINVGTAKEPKLRFRLSTVIAWEIANEKDRCEAEPPMEVRAKVPAGAPAGWDGVRRAVRSGGGPRK